MYFSLWTERMGKYRSRVAFDNGLPPILDLYVEKHRIAILDAQSGVTLMTREGTGIGFTDTEETTEMLAAMVSICLRARIPDLDLSAHASSVNNEGK